MEKRGSVTVEVDEIIEEFIDKIEELRKTLPENYRKEVLEETLRTMKRIKPSIKRLRATSFKDFRDEVISLLLRLFDTHVMVHGMAALEKLQSQKAQKVFLEALGKEGLDPEPIE